MIPVSFVHESLPSGGLSAELLAIPNREDIVRLNNQNFVVKAVAHVVTPSEEGGPGTYVVFVYLYTPQEYAKSLKGYR